MSLHTKYRPTKLDDVLGQGAVVKAFGAALTKSHAFLLVGPSGVGKTTLARIGAAQLGCHQRDISEIDAATYTGVEAMRAITAAAQYNPLHGKVKCTIIDEVHMLSSSAFNSLLKPLEEPAQFMYWYLCTTELRKVPDTIRTRCVMFSLTAVDSDVLFDMIKDIAEKEDLKAADNEGVLELCVKEARGSPRQAIVNLEACGHTSDRRIAAELLKTAEGNPKAFELAKLLMDGAPWSRVQSTINDMRDLNPESIRHVVLDYLTKVALSAKSEKSSARVLEILDKFGTPFHHGDGISPVLLACARAMLQ